MAKRDAKVADIRKRNAKEFDDNYRRPTRRSRAGMLPMEIVVADVHPVDVLVERLISARLLSQCRRWQ